MTLFYPLDTALVSEWPGPRDGGTWHHYGTDFAVPVNTPLRASFDGVIVYARGDGATGQINGVWANGEGLTVDIQRSDGLIARYGHLNRIDVKPGQRVKAGQQIGLSGNTGYTTGPHCHWELRYDRAWSGGAWRDPRTLGAKPLPKPEEPVTEAEMNKIADKVVAKLMAHKVKQTGTDKHGKPRTGTMTLGTFLSTWLNQVGITRRIVERIDENTRA